MLSRIEQQKIQVALELKFLLTQDNHDPDASQRIIQIINSYEPFTQNPIRSAPPAEMYDCHVETLITSELKQQLSNYTYLVLAGSVFIRSNGSEHQSLERLYLDSQKLEQMVVELQNSSLLAQKNTFLLKIHNVWLQNSKTALKCQRIGYIRKKLMLADYFLELSYGDFNRVCQSSTVLTVGANQFVEQQHTVPNKIYCVAQGLLEIQSVVRFRKDVDLLDEFLDQTEKHQPKLEQFIEEFIQDPTQQELDSLMYFDKKIQLKELGPGSIICAKECLEEKKLNYSVRAVIKSKVIAIESADVFSIDKDQMRRLKSLKELFESEPRQVRKRYYTQLPWNQYKQFLISQVEFTKKTRQFNFDRELRTDLDLNSKKYSHIKDPFSYVEDQSMTKDQLSKNPVKRMSYIQKAFESK